ncbi:MAG: 2-C-methyl-D-erythritol 4-phosphate cytidylyltransferase [Candidatus Omnitrophota bacterium]
MKVTCIVAAGGKGRRLKARQDKPFVMLGEKPLLSHTLRALENCNFIDSIIVVVSRGKLKACERLVKKYGFRKVRAVVGGGRRRFDSVKNGLREAQNADFVLIHDGARPFVSRDLVKRVFLAARKSGAALCATPMKQTVKRAGENFFVSETPRRKFLWEAQTPQGFKKDLISKAYREAKDRGVTDDASLVEKLGHKVKIVKGSSGNIKITTPEDLELAKLLMKKPTRLT